MRSVAGGLGARAAAVAVRGGATRVSSWLTTSSSLLALTRHGESMPRPRWPSKNVSPPGVGNSHIGRALSLKAAKRASKLRARESARKASKKAKLQAKDPAGPMAQAEIQAWLKTPGICQCNAMQCNAMPPYRGKARLVDAKVHTYPQGLTRRGKASSEGTKRSVSPATSEPSIRAGEMRTAALAIRCSSCTRTTASPRTRPCGSRSMPSASSQAVF